MLETFESLKHPKVLPQLLSNNHVEEIIINRSAKNLSMKAGLLPGGGIQKLHTLIE